MLDVSLKGGDGGCSGSSPRDGDGGCSGTSPRDGDGGCSGISSRDISLIGGVVGRSVIVPKYGCEPEPCKPHPITETDVPPKDGDKLDSALDASLYSNALLRYELLYSNVLSGFGSLYPVVVSDISLRVRVGEVSDIVSREISSTSRSGAVADSLVIDCGASLTKIGGFRVSDRDTLSNGGSSPRSVIVPKYGREPESCELHSITESDVPKKDGGGLCSNALLRYESLYSNAPLKNGSVVNSLVVRDVSRKNGIVADIFVENTGILVADAGGEDAFLFFHLKRQLKQQFPKDVSLADETGGDSLVVR